MPARSRSRPRTAAPATWPPATWRRAASSGSASPRSLRASGPESTGADMPTALRLTGHEKDLGGGFLVRRILPAAQRRSVGPFIFFDHFGPVNELPTANHDVRPHPHIGLATV